MVASGSRAHCAHCPPATERTAHRTHLATLFTSSLGLNRSNKTIITYSFSLLLFIYMYNTNITL